MTRRVIREMRAGLAAEERVAFRRSSSADWIELSCASTADEALLLELARRAVEANRRGDDARRPRPS